MTNDPTTPALVVIKGPAKDRFLALETNLVTIGRGDDADICLTGDSSISRIHLSLRLVNNRYVLTNKSDNGTQVNDKLADEHELRNGDRIRVGDVYLLEYSDGSKPVTPPRRSMFAKPAVLAACSVYLAAMIGAALYLSNMSSKEDRLDSQRVSIVLNGYAHFLTAANIAKLEQEARQSAIRGYLRAAFIAEREGNFLEARRIYLRVLDYATDGKNPVYQYALERLRSLPVEQK